MHENDISGLIVDACYKAHTGLGPGLLESVYEEAIAYELSAQGIPFTRQQAIPVVYQGVKLEIGFRADIFVMNKVILEIKSIEAIAPVHLKVLLTYLRLSGSKLGLLVNFNEMLIKDGIRRVVNGL